MKKPTTTYPERPAFFAHRFCRLLTKLAVAQDIGSEACWMLTIIAHQEDSIRYRRAVTYYNEQLMPLCGFGGRSRLVTARRKAIEAGWLHYEPGGKGKPGTYWVLVPERYEDVEDTACDESSEPVSRPESGQQTENAVPNQDGNSDLPSQNRTTTGRQTDGKRTANAHLPSPSPKPTPTPKTKGGVVGESQGKKPSKVKEPQTPIPDSLDTPAFHKAWADFLEHRREMKHPATALAQTRLLNQCEKWGEARAVEAIDISIGSGWRGLFEPRGNAATAAQPELINPADYLGKDKS